MSYIPLPMDVNNNVMTRISQHDIFDQVIMANRTNQITASFFTPDAQPTDFMNVTTTGGGTASMGGGKALFQTGTATTASVTAQTVTTVQYTPGFEVYSIFTTTFTTPTSANSNQLVGLWDITENGFYIGYKGTTFGVALMAGGTETFIARSNWNGDPLNGSATSKYTRNGTPEAINFNYINLFRIRFGWLGAAPVLYEVCSPDGNWVTFHTIAYPNTSASPHIQNPNLPLSLKIDKASADSTNIAMTCACWAAGTAASNSISVSNAVESTWTSSTGANTAVTADSTSAGNVSISVIKTGTISAGVATFEVSPDGTNWFPLKVTNLSGAAATSTHDIVSGSATFQAYVGGFIQTRVRLSTAITGAGTARIEIRPTSESAPTSLQVYQPSGANLHVQIDPASTTGLAPAAVSVGTTSTAVLSANQSRKGLIVTNTSSNTISFGLDGNPAVLYSGITIFPNGMWAMDQYTFTKGAITAIASGAASNLAIQEMQ